MTTNMPAAAPTFDARAQVRTLLATIQPASAAEHAHWSDAMDWVDSGAPLFRTAKPATPPKHLVAYFPIVDGDYMLLVDHKNAQRWLPTGGHVEPDECPTTTVMRELHEELGIEVRAAQISAPLLVTVAPTVGLTGGHVDVSLWFPVRLPRATPLRFDTSEFNAVRWFHHSEAVRLETDPYLGMFLAKLAAP